MINETSRRMNAATLNVNNTLIPFFDEPYRTMLANELKRRAAEKRTFLKGDFTSDARLDVLLEGGMVVRNDRCPECGSRDLKNNGRRKRMLKPFFGPQVRVLVQKYGCNRCGSYFQAKAPGILRPKSPYPATVVNRAVELVNIENAVSASAARTTERMTGFFPSRSTVNRWARPDDPQVVFDAGQIGHVRAVRVDEDRIRIRGSVWWLHAAADVDRDFPFLAILYPEPPARNEGAAVRDGNGRVAAGRKGRKRDEPPGRMKAFFEAMSNRCTTDLLITDEHKAYPGQIRKYFHGARHQWDVWHDLCNVSEKLGLRLEKGVKSADSITAVLFYRRYAEIFRAGSVKEVHFLAERLLEEYYPARPMRRVKDPAAAAVRKICRRLIDNEARLLAYTEFGTKYRTTSPAENLFRQLLLRGLKRLFNSPKHACRVFKAGLIRYIARNSKLTSAEKRRCMASMLPGGGHTGRSLSRYVTVLQRK